MKSDHVVDLSPAMFADPVSETDHVIRDATTARRRTQPVVLNTTRPAHNIRNPILPLRQRIILPYSYDVQRVVGPTTTKVPECTIYNVNLFKI